MKRILILAVALAAFAHPGFAQATRFVNTVQDFRCHVIDFREDGLTGCFRNGVLVNPSPADLKPNDVFIDVDGVAKKVAGVQRVGNDLYIDTVRARFEEVFLSARIPDQVIVFNQENFIADTEAGPYYTASEGGTRARFELPTFEREIYKKEPMVVKVSVGAVLDSSISIGFLAPTVTLTSWKWWKAESWRQNKGYIKGRLTLTELSVTATLTVALEGSKESTPILLYGFGTPTPGVAANLGLMTKTALEGTLNLSLPLTLKADGFSESGCTLAGQFPVMWPTDCWKNQDFGYEVKVAPALTAEATLKQKFYVGGDVTVVGIKISEFEAGGGPYLKLSGSISGEIGYNSRTGIVPSWPPPFTAEASGEIGLFVNVEGKIWDGKWKVTFFSREFPFVRLSTSDGLTFPVFSRSGRPAIPFTPRFVPADLGLAALRHIHGWGLL